MKHNWKKMLRIGLLTAAIASVACFSAGALSENGLEYVVQGGEAYITGPKDYQGDLVIPSTIGGKTVTKIEKQAFYEYPHNKGITSVTIPGSVREIGDMAFENNINLTSVKIASGLQTIKGQAFSGTASLKSIDLPDTVTTIGKGAFSGSSTNKSGLEKIRLPKNLKEIPEGAFHGCPMKSIDIPDSVAVIGESAFSYSDLRTLKLPGSLKKVPKNMCYNCESLVSVTIPAGVTELGEKAFRDCVSLKEANLPTSLTYISLYVFFNTGLEEVILPYGLEKCYPFTFDNCPNLEALYVPSTVKDFSAPLKSPNCVVYCTQGSKAEADCQKYKVSYDYDPSVDALIHVRYNGRRISFGDQGQNPVIESGRTLVPLRAIFETMGATVDWDNATRTITATRGSTIVKLTLGDKTLYKNGKAVMTLDVPAKALNGRTVVPARAVAEAFGANVGWNAAARIVTINE